MQDGRLTGARGPKSKRGAVRRNKPKATTSKTAAHATAPALPEDTGPQARAWWAAFVGSPHAELYSGTDWQALLRGVVLVDLFYEKPSAQLAAEIRAIESKVGATVADRDRLGWKIEEPVVEQPADAPTPSRERPDPRRR